MNVRDELLKKNGHFTVREFKRSMNLCLYKAMTPELRTSYMVSFFLNACAIYAIYDGGHVGGASSGSPDALPEVDGDFPSFEDGATSFEEAIFEIKKVMYERSPKDGTATVVDQNFDVGKVIAILYQLDKQYGWELYESAKRYGK